MKTIEINVNKHNEHILDCISTLQNINEQCGLTTKEYTINTKFGFGKITSWNFDGLIVRKHEITFTSHIKFWRNYKMDALLFSIMLNGEKRITFPDFKIEALQENMESYISFIDTAIGYVFYAKDKLFREIVIKMSSEFIKKHQLELSLPLHKHYAPKYLQNNFTNQLNYKTQYIAEEILNNNEIGLLKRLFLEAKVLELLMLQFANKNKITNNSTKLKKIYLVRDLITHNLNIQFSTNKLSKKVYLNEFLLKKEFKNTFGTTIFEFALQKRMKKSKELLLNTSKPIYEIAELVGYKNSTHFSAAFKKKKK